MNRIALSVVLVGLGAVAGLFVSSGLAEPTTVVRGPDAEKLTALRKERRDVLRQAVKESEEAYRHGVIPYTSIPRITVNLLNAELDLASDRAARIAIRERAVDQFREIEKAVAERVEAAVADRTDLLEARAVRLQAEIDLLRERADAK
jgi:outer membrane protein TolC